MPVIACGGCGEWPIWPDIGEPRRGRSAAAAGARSCLTGRTGGARSPPGIREPNPPRRDTATVVTRARARGDECRRGDDRARRPGRAPLAFHSRPVRRSARRGRWPDHSRIRAEGRESLRLRGPGSAAAPDSSERSLQGHGTCGLRPWPVHFDNGGTPSWPSRTSRIWSKAGRGRLPHRRRGTGRVS